MMMDVMWFAKQSIKIEDKREKEEKKEEKASDTHLLNRKEN